MTPSSVKLLCLLIVDTFGYAITHAMAMTQIIPRIKRRMSNSFKAHGLENSVYNVHDIVE